MGSICNVILCEDVREEIGNKKSLMGIFGGDLLVPEMPATLQLAVFFQYMPSSPDEQAVSIAIELFQDDMSIAKGGMQGHIANAQPASFILPRALITFEKDSVFRLMVSINEGAAQEVLSKKIIKTVSQIS
jgi:hypothetical protein